MILLLLRDSDFEEVAILEGTANLLNIAQIYIHTHTHTPSGEKDIVCKMMMKTKTSTLTFFSFLNVSCLHKLLHQTLCGDGKFNEGRKEKDV